MGMEQTYAGNLSELYYGFGLCFTQRIDIHYADFTGEMVIQLQRAYTWHVL